MGKLSLLDIKFLYLYSNLIYKNPTVGCLSQMNSNNNLTGTPNSICFILQPFGELLGTIFKIIKKKKKVLHENINERKKFSACECVLY